MKDNYTSKKLRYIWLDNIGNIRNKMRMVSVPEDTSYDDMKKYIPKWGFDGSSTEQAPTENSDLKLNPVRYTKPSSCLNDEIVVLCEVLNLDDSHHEDEYRHIFCDLDQKHDNEWTFGFEQEYFMFNKEGTHPYRWPKDGYPHPQGKYYCGSGADEAWGEEIVREHFDACLEIGLDVCGTNAEVAPAQWEFQIGPYPSGSELYIPKAEMVVDGLIIARYMLFRIAAKHGVSIKLHPKLTENYDKNWNGSGMHTNFSNKTMRETSTGIENAISGLQQTHAKCMDLYGEGNDKRLVGSYETSSYDEFSAGQSDRECGIRTPIQTQENGKGYLEDRRPAANANPYAVAAAIIQSVEEGKCDF